MAELSNTDYKKLIHMNYLQYKQDLLREKHILENDVLSTFKNIFAFLYMECGNSRAAK